MEDATGGVLPGVLVSLSLKETNQRFTATTDAKGRYQFLRLPPGNYLLRVDATGFNASERVFPLALGQALDFPIRVQVAGSDEIVEVAGQAPSIEAVRTQIAQSVSRAAVDSLPLNGCNYLDLALLAPGVSRTNTGAPQQMAETSAVPGTGISVSGQRNLNNSFVLDGLSANDDAAGLAGAFYSQEVIREFQVVTGGGNAEFGRASSGVVNMTTRSGTNDPHGRLYGFLRNQRLDARNTLATRKDPLTQTQFGASFGRAVQHDRTFVFSNFEQSHRNAAGFVTIPAANAGQINAALDRFAFSGPRVTTGEFGTGHDMTSYFARIDHRLSAANQLATRYSFYDIGSANARSAGGLSAVSRGASLANRDQSIALNLVSTISPHDINEARFQFTRSRLSAPGNDLTGPAVSIAGVANFGASTSSPTGRDNDLFEATDTFSSQRGAHFLKAGADALYNRLNIVFPGSLVAAVYSFSSISALEAGRYSTFQQAFGAPNQFQANPNAGFFAQDEWRVSRRLTMNLGVRYDLQFLPAPIRTDTNNIAPRFGLAWSPDDRKMVVRAYYGIYYDRVPLRATSNALQRDGSKYRVALLSFGQAGAPVFPSQLSAFPSGQYINITTIDPGIQNSYSHQSGLQIDRDLGWSTVSIGYQWVRTLHLILSRNVNVPTLSAAEASARGIPNLGRPDSRYGNISRYEGSGDSYYHGMLVSWQARPWRGGEIRAAYTLSKTIDDVGNFFFSAPQNNFDLRDDRGLSDNDQRHRVAISAVLESPRRGGPAFGGWQLSPLFLYTSALPYNVLVNFDRNSDTSTNDRPAGIGRNTGRGFNFASLDVRLSRSFRLAERVSMRVMMESFNTLNRSNWAVPNNVIGSGTGAPLSSFGKPTAVYDPRQLQLGLRFEF